MNSAIPEIFFIGVGATATVPGTIAQMGFKAFNLARLAAVGARVPPAFVFGTAVCREFYGRGEKLPERALELLTPAVQSLERASQLTLGSARRPLLVSVRSGAPVSMPGMMETILNIGLCDATLPGMLRLFGNPRLAWDCYRRLVQGFGEIVHGIDGKPFDAVLRRQLDAVGADRAQDLDFRALRDLTREYLEIFAGEAGVPFPQSPTEQLRAAIAAVLRSWNAPKACAYRRTQGIDGAVGTAVTIQQMVFGNADGSSGSGVAFTRDPSTGENRLYLDFAVRAQGEDVVSGRVGLSHNGDFATELPEVHRQLLDIRQLLEAEFQDAQEFEFTVQSGALYLLQTRTAKRTPLASLRIAVEMVDEGVIDAPAALQRVGDLESSSLEIATIDEGTGTLLARGTAASIGVAVGEISFEARDALARVHSGAAVILVREDIATSDIEGIQAAAGVLTTRGGRTSHAAVVARQLGKPCVVACELLRIDADQLSCRFGDVTLHRGDIISLDAATGRVLLGRAQERRQRPQELLARVAAWRTAASAAAA